jgi:microcin C transport system substrate-binding protein
LRRNLLRAKALLKNAGYSVKDEILYTPFGERVAFEVMLNDPVQEKIALQWVRQLKRLGIVARSRTVDSAQYQERLASFDFDVTVVKWNNSLSPGNEQMLFWGSAAAQQQGSRNYPGIHDVVVDALASSIPAADTRDELVATTRALDRVLLRGHYLVPFFYSDADQMAFWTRVQHPAITPLYGAITETWWAQSAAIR